MWQALDSSELELEKMALADDEGTRVRNIITGKNLKHYSPWIHIDSVDLRRLCVDSVVENVISRTRDSKDSVLGAHVHVLKILIGILPGEGIDERPEFRVDRGLEVGHPPRLQSKKVNRVEIRQMRTAVYVPAQYDNETHYT